MRIEVQDGCGGLLQQHMRVLRNIIFSGAVDGVENIIGFDHDVTDIVNELHARGLVETVSGIIAPTQDGLEALETWYEKDRQELEQDWRDSLLDEFRPLDRELKRLATEWQHAKSINDWDKKLGVVEDLSSLHQSALEFLDRHSEKLARFDEYRRRMEKAHAQILDGQTEYVDAVNLDSYHTLWFHLHEDLLRLLQRERDAE